MSRNVNRAARRTVPLMTPRTWLTTRQIEENLRSAMDSNAIQQLRSPFGTEFIKEEEEEEEEEEGENDDEKNDEDRNREIMELKFQQSRRKRQQAKKADPKSDGSKPNKPQEIDTQSIIRQFNNTLQQITASTSSDQLRSVKIEPSSADVNKTPPSVVRERPNPVNRKRQNFLTFSDDDSGFDTKSVAASSTIIEPSVSAERTISRQSAVSSSIRPTSTELTTTDSDTWDTELLLIDSRSMITPPDNDLNSDTEHDADEYHLTDDTVNVIEQLSTVANERANIEPTIVLPGGDSSPDIDHQYQSTSTQPRIQSRQRRVRGERRSVSDPVFANYQPLYDTRRADYRRRMTSDKSVQISRDTERREVCVNTEIDMLLMTAIVEKILIRKFSVSTQTEPLRSGLRDVAVGTEKFSRERFSQLPETRSKLIQTDSSWLRTRSIAVSTDDAGIDAATVAAASVAAANARRRVKLLRQYQREKTSRDVQTECTGKVDASNDVQSFSEDDYISETTGNGDTDHEQTIGELRLLSTDDGRERQRPTDITHGFNERPNETSRGSVERPIVKPIEGARNFTGSSTDGSASRLVDGGRNSLGASRDSVERLLDGARGSLERSTDGSRGFSERLMIDGVRDSTEMPTEATRGSPQKTFENSRGSVERQQIESVSTYMDEPLESVRFSNPKQTDGVHGTTDRPTAAVRTSTLKSQDSLRNKTERFGLSTTQPSTVRDQRRITDLGFIKQDEIRQQYEANRRRLSDIDARRAEMMSLTVNDLRTAKTSPKNMEKSRSIGCQMTDCDESTGDERSIIDVSETELDEPTVRPLSRTSQVKFQQTESEINQRKPTATKSAETAATATNDVITIKPGIEIGGRTMRTQSKVIISISQANKRETSEITSLTEMDKNGKLSRKTHVTTSKKVATLDASTPTLIIEPITPSPQPLPVDKTDSLASLSSIKPVSKKVYHSSSQPKSTERISSPLIQSATPPISENDIIDVAGSRTPSTATVGNQLIESDGYYGQYRPSVAAPAASDKVYQWHETNYSTICSELSTDGFKDEHGRLHKPNAVTLSTETSINNRNNQSNVEMRSRAARKYSNKAINEPEIMAHTRVYDPSAAADEANGNDSKLRPMINDEDGSGGREIRSVRSRGEGGVESRKSRRRDRDERLDVGRDSRRSRSRENDLADLKRVKTGSHEGVVEGSISVGRDSGLADDGGRESQRGRRSRDGRVDSSASVGRESQRSRDDGLDTDRESRRSRAVDDHRSSSRHHRRLRAVIHDEIADNNGGHQRKIDTRCDQWPREKPELNDEKTVIRTSRPSRHESRERFFADLTGADKVASTVDDFSKREERDQGLDDNEPSVNICHSSYNRSYFVATKSADSDINGDIDHRHTDTSDQRANDELVAPREGRDSRSTVSSISSRKHRHRRHRHDEAGKVDCEQLHDNHHASKKVKHFSADGGMSREKSNEGLQPRVDTDYEQQKSLEADFQHQWSLDQQRSAERRHQRALEAIELERQKTLEAEYQHQKSLDSHRSAERHQQALEEAEIEHERSLEADFQHHRSFLNQKSPERHHQPRTTFDYDRQKSPDQHRINYVQNQPPNLASLGSCVLSPLESPVPTESGRHRLNSGDSLDDNRPHFTSLSAEYLNGDTEHVDNRRPTSASHKSYLSRPVSTSAAPLISQSTPSVLDNDDQHTFNKSPITARQYASDTQIGYKNVTNLNGLNEPLKNEKPIESETQSAGNSSNNNNGTEIITRITKTTQPSEYVVDANGRRHLTNGRSRIILEQQLQSADQLNESAAGGVNTTGGGGAEPGCKISSIVTMETPIYQTSNFSMPDLNDPTQKVPVDKSASLDDLNDQGSINGGEHHHVKPPIGGIGEVVTSTKFQRHRPKNERGHQQTTWEYSMECNCLNGVNTSVRTSVKHKRTYLPYSLTQYESSV